MNVLEKILEEMENESKLAHEEMRRCARGNPLQFDEVKGYARAMEYVVDTIRSHMDEIPNCEGCSRRKWYQKGFEDGKKDNDWIPVEERLPNKNGVYNVTRLVDDAFISDSAYFDGQDTWHNDNRVNHTRPYLTDIVAWHPLPKPYKDWRER